MHTLRKRGWLAGLVKKLRRPRKARPRDIFGPQIWEGLTGLKGASR